MFKWADPNNLASLLSMVYLYIQTVVGVIQGVLNGLDTRIEALENTDYEFNVDLTTGNLVYDKVTTEANGQS